MVGDIFQQLDELLTESGPQGVLDRLATHFDDAQRFHELFEVRKMQVRQQLGLPLLYTDSGEELPQEQRDTLERGLLDACREIGVRLLKSGKLREAWHYLRAIGDTSLIKTELSQQEPNEDNLDEFIELCLHENLDLERGFQLMLQSYGTCNSITTFDSAMYGRPREERAIGAGLLVEHVDRELRENIVGHIEREEGKPPAADAKLGDLIADRDWLFADGCYHIDTTHLASVVGFARELSDTHQLQLALDLVRYGSKLDASLQYDAEAPFCPLYAASLRYFEALLNRDQAEHLEFFRAAAEAVSPREDTTLAIEVYIDLLSRTGHARQALDEALRLLPQDIQQTGHAPTLMELATAADDFGPVQKLSKERDDALGYALSLLNRRS